MTHETQSEAGFSLAELLVAMLVTMLVSGAVFGLISAGQGAFKREPELTDRQQNIRLAMDLVQRDVAVAGMGLLDTANVAVNPFTQVFTPLDGFSGTSNAPSGQPVDALEVLGATGDCPEVRIGAGAGTNTLTTSFPLPRCFGTDGIVAVAMSDGSYRWGLAHGMAENGSTVAFTGNQPARGGLAGGIVPATPAPVSITRMQWVRYQIGADADGVPALWRSETGGLDPTNGAPVGNPPAATAGWQIVARGIEDLQVRYRPAGPAAVFSPTALVPAPGTWANITQQVEVTLWARAITPGPAAQGMTTPNGAVAARRGALTSVTSPRAALFVLGAAPPPYTWN